MRGAALGAASKLVQAVATITAFVIVARQIGPEGYGVYALAWVIAGLLEVFVLSAPTEALIQRRVLRRGHLSATFWAGVGFAVLVVALIVTAAGPLAAALGGGAALAALLPWRLLTVPIAAATAAPAALLARRSRFGRIAAIESVSGLCGGAAAVVAVFQGLDVWSLLVGDAVRVALWSSATFVSAGWRPGRPTRIADFTDLLAFNAVSWTAWGVAHFDQQVPRLVIGASMGPHALGLYAVGERLLTQSSQVLLLPAYQTLVVATARLRQDREGVRGLLLPMQQTLAAVALPVFLGAAAVAPALVPLVFGQAWADASTVVAVMMLLGVRATIGVLQSAVVRGLGRTGWHLGLVLVGMGLTLLFVPAAARWGVEAVAVALLVRGLALGPLQGLMVRRLTGLPLREQFASWIGPLAAAAAMAITVAVALPALDAAGGPVGALAAAVAGGVSLYVLALWILAPAASRRLAGLLRGGRLGEVGAARPRTPARVGPGAG